MLVLGFGDGGSGGAADGSVRRQVLRGMMRRKCV